MSAVDSPTRQHVAAERLLDGRYRIEGLLGDGGMATVWRARDLRLDRAVAIKELSGEGMRQPRALERFDREARAVGRLSHPNVVSVYDVGTQDGMPYLVMELVEGPTVARLLADGPLPVVDVLAVGAQVCDGLTAAHAAGIIHRDIKPANLIFSPSGVVKICDFGVARLLDPPGTRNGSGNLTGPATAMGSPSYMAPEQISRERLDPRTDLYALGCTMYAMLVGTPPFTTGGAFGIVHQHITKPPEPVHLRRSDVPPAVEALIADLLAKRPDERPPDAATVRGRIAAAQADPATAAARSVVFRSAIGPSASAAPTTTAALPVGDQRPASPTALPRTPATARRRWAVAAVGAAAIAALVAVVVPAMVHSGTGSAAARWTGSTGSTVATSTQKAATSPTTVDSATPAPSAAGTNAAPSAAAGTNAAPSAAATQPLPPTDPIVGLRQAIAAQVTAGGLKADAATDLNHMVDDLAKTIATGNSGEVTSKLKALRDKLTSLNREGKLSADGYRALSGAVDQVAAGQG